MTTFLFWNLQNKPLEELVCKIVDEHGVDFVILSEADEVSPSSLLKVLNRISPRFFFHPSTVPNNARLVVSTFPSNCVRSVADAGGLSFRQIKPQTGTDFLLVTAHLGSKLHLRDSDQAQLATHWASRIAEEEVRMNHERTIVVGDFNMNPFEDGMVSGFGFHAASTRNRAMKQSRTINGSNSNRFFYNPMWRCFGERHGAPPGSYHRAGSNPVEYFWHLFDQVLIRPELLTQFDDNKLRILTKAQNESLVSKSGVPNQLGSDHLPLIFHLDL